MIWLLKQAARLVVGLVVAYLTFMLFFLIILYTGYRKWADL